MSDQGTGQPLALPSGATTDPVANGRHKGQMPRWATASATIASFATRAVAGHSDIYVPLATASLAGSLSAADFAKLAGMEAPVLRLNYIAPAAADLANALALAANTWVNIGPNSAFTWASTAATGLAWARGVVNGGAVAVAAPLLGARFLFDGATPVPIAGNIAPNTAANAFANFLAGSAPVWLAALAAGAHTVQLQVICNVAAVAYCRPATQPNFENLGIMVVEQAP